MEMWKAILIMCAVGSHGYFWDLDFGMHSSLKKGSTLTPLSGVYLKDSWRTQVIVPTMEKLKEKLRKIQSDPRPRLWEVDHHHWSIGSSRVGSEQEEDCKDASQRGK